MCNEEISQGQIGGGWKIFLEEARRRLADANDGKERRQCRRTVRAFELLLLWESAMPRQAKSYAATQN